MMPNCSGPMCHNTSNTMNTPFNPINLTTPPYPNQNEYTEIDNLPFYERTDFVPPTPNVTDIPSYSGVVATEENPNGYIFNPAIGTGGSAGVNTSSGRPVAAVPGTPAGSLPSQQEVFQDSPLFEVPPNPLLPPGYQNVLDYGNLQYMNGFLRTQMGKYVRVQHLLGSNVIEDRYGYLVGVGVNYILLQEISTGNILVLDFYNIKYVYIYYTTPDLPQNEIR